MSSEESATNSYISSKILSKMESIISIIKDMDILLRNKDQGLYKRLLYRSMDQLAELESSLRQLQVSLLSSPTA